MRTAILAIVATIGTAALTGPVNATTLMHAAGRRCPDRPAASYQTRRGQPGKLPMAPGMRCRTGFPTLQHFHQRDK